MTIQESTKNWRVVMGRLSGALFVSTVVACCFLYATPISARAVTCTVVQGNVPFETGGWPNPPYQSGVIAVGSVGGCNGTVSVWVSLWEDGVDPHLDTSVGTAKPGVGFIGNIGNNCLFDSGHTHAYRTFVEVSNGQQFLSAPIVTNLACYY